MPLQIVVGLNGEGEPQIAHILVDTGVPPGGDAEPSRQSQRGVAAVPVSSGKIAQLPPCGIRKLTFRSDLRITSADASLCVDGEERPSVRSRRLCAPVGPTAVSEWGKEPGGPCSRTSHTS